MSFKSMDVKLDFFGLQNGIFGTKTYFHAKKAHFPCQNQHLHITSKVLFVWQIMALYIAGYQRRKCPDTT